MYKHYFGLHDRPFELSPHPDCCFRYPGWDQVKTDLENAVRSPSGIKSLIAEKGLGKTLLCQCLKQEIQFKDETLYLGQSQYAHIHTLAEKILEELGYPEPLQNERQAHRKLTEVAQSVLPRGRGIVLFLDDAQHISPELLREVHALLQIRLEHAPLVRVILSGQPILQQHLKHPAALELATLLTFNTKVLLPLSREESINYLKFRLQLAGGDADAILLPETCEAISQACQGVPLLMNQLADHVLLLSFLHSGAPCEVSTVHQAIHDLDHLPFLSKGLERISSSGWENSSSYHSNPTAVEIESDIISSNSKKDLQKGSDCESLGTPSIDTPRTLEREDMSALPHRNEPSTTIDERLESLKQNLQKPEKTSSPPEGERSEEEEELNVIEVGAGIDDPLASGRLSIFGALRQKSDTSEDKNDLSAQQEFEKQEQGSVEESSKDDANTIPFNTQQANPIADSRAGEDENHAASKQTPVEYQQSENPSEEELPAGMPIEKDPYHDWIGPLETDRDEQAREELKEKPNHEQNLPDRSTTETETSSNQRSAHHQSKAEESGMTSVLRNQSHTNVPGKSDLETYSDHAVQSGSVWMPHPSEIPASHPEDLIDQILPMVKEALNQGDYAHDVPSADEELEHASTEIPSARSFPQSELSSEHHSITSSRSEQTTEQDVGTKLEVTSLEVQPGKTVHEVESSPSKITPDTEVSEVEEAVESTTASCEHSPLPPLRHANEKSTQGRFRLLFSRLRRKHFGDNDS